VKELTVAMEFFTQKEKARGKGRTAAGEEKMGASRVWHREIKRRGSRWPRCGCGGDGSEHERLVLPSLSKLTRMKGIRP
jgi:hypothetical protein